MKKSLLAVAVAGAFAGAAHAADQQDQLVTLYGVIDGAIRYSTNVNAGGSSYTGFSQGLYNGSRFGIKGTEDLGSGKKAIYALEGGFVLGTGQSDQNGQLFGRQAWFGVSDGMLGTVTIGRQYGTLSDTIGMGDVFGEKHGNLVYSGGAGNGTPNQGDVVAENTFFYKEMGFRWDNSIKYANKFGPISLSLMHSFQGQTNGTTTAQQSGNAMTMNSASVGFGSEKFNISAGYQKENDLTNAAGAQPTHTVWGVGTNFMFGEKSGVYAFYMNSKFDASFTQIGLGTNSQVGSAGAFGRKDTIFSVAANYYVTSSVNLIAAFYRDSASNIAAAGDSGSRNGFLVTADYYSSKTTDTYIALGHTSFSGNLVGGNGNIAGIATGAPVGTGPSSSNLAMLGLRHRF